MDEKQLKLKLDAIEELVKKLKFDTSISKEKSLELILVAIRSKYGFSQFK